MFSKYSKTAIAALMALVLLISANALSAFASSTEEDEAAKRIQRSLENATVVWHDGSTGSSDSAATVNPTDGLQLDTSSIDLLAYAKESIALTNSERVSAGLNELEINDEMMELAATRAQELAEKYNHERPDGTRVSTAYYYGEIINRRASTPSFAVESWMSSTKGHKEMILANRYQYVGAGCYQDNDGTVYWVQLFSR